MNRKRLHFLGLASALLAVSSVFMGSCRRSVPPPPPPPPPAGAPSSSGLVTPPASQRGWTSQPGQSGALPAGG